MSARPLVLTIAGFDPSCGAGIAADLEVFAAFGCRGAAAVAGLTAQSSHGVTAVAPLPDQFVGAQLDAVMRDGLPSAVKTGMLATADSVHAVAAAMRRMPAVPLVIDPVLASSGGARLGDRAAAEALSETLLPMAALVTPNAAEACALTAIEVVCAESAAAAGRVLVQRGAHAALVKGGHVLGRVVTDVLVQRGGAIRRFERTRIDTGRARRGTGCALSAAIAACLARGLELTEAVRVAGDFVHAAIAAAYETGGGALTLDRSVRVPGMPD
jgi:hydroxymethylpyrimidine kinase/phosphomethylpyrimidine kinase